tara:strand:- start:54 stop:1124 length:1071 start_codon:yes stop_codon:yes gene_type:complete
MRGVTVKISGYSDKQSNLLIKIINSLKNVSFTEDRFAIIKERLKRRLDNAKDKKPYEQALARAQNILINPSWTEAERLAALIELNLNDINKHREQFLSELEAVLFVNGNLSRASALTIAQQIDATLLKHTKTSHVDRAKITKLEGESTKVSTVQVKHSDTGYVYYLQGKDKSTEEQAKLLLLNQVISTDFYGSIRTDKQLGYIVFSTNFNLLDVPAITFIIQSPVAKGDLLLKESRLFLDAQLSVIPNMSDESLDRYKSAVISKLLKQDNNLYSRSNRYWQDIDRENYEFDTNEDLAKAITGIKLDDLNKTLEELVMDKGRSLLIYTYQEEYELNVEEFGLIPMIDKADPLFSTFK